MFIFIEVIAEFKLYSARLELFRTNWVNIMVTDALVPYVATKLAAMMLIVQDNRVFAFPDNGF